MGLSHARCSARYFAYVNWPQLHYSLWFYRGRSWGLRENFAVYIVSNSAGTKSQACLTPKCKLSPTSPHGLWTHHCSFHMAEGRIFCLTRWSMATRAPIFSRPFPGIEALSKLLLEKQVICFSCVLDVACLWQVHCVIFRKLSHLLPKLASFWRVSGEKGCLWEFFICATYAPLPS